MKDLIGQEVSVGDKVLHVTATSGRIGADIRTVGQVDTGATRGKCQLIAQSGYGRDAVDNPNGRLSGRPTQNIVVITKQLSKQPLLTEDDAENLEFLEALNAAGVDNWQGIDEAHEIVKEWRKERGEVKD